MSLLNAALARAGRDFPFDMKGLYDAIAPGHAVRRRFGIAGMVIIVIAVFSAGTHYYVSSIGIGTNDSAGHRVGRASKDDPIVVPPMIAQVSISSPADMSISLQSEDGTFPSLAEYLAPARLSLRTAAMHRLKLGQVPEFADHEFYPSLEIRPPTSLIEGFLHNNPIVIEFTEEEFLLVASGKEVTKVFFLPDPEFQEMYTIGLGPPTPVMASYELDPGTDAIIEADRCGTILAVLRLGSIDLEVPMDAR